MGEFAPQQIGDQLTKEVNEEVVENGLGVLVKKKTLFHGSGTSGIENFNKAEEDTVGSGIYLTSELKDATGYALRRSRRNGSAPVVYESIIENIKLLDLRRNENVRKILVGFEEIIKGKLKQPNLNWVQEGRLQKVVNAIESGKIGAGNLREVTFSTGAMFSEYVKSLGYEGLIAIEGGEGNDVGIHDTFLVFDPKRVKINKEDTVS